jgi:hypothetical protein
MIRIVVKSNFTVLVPKPSRSLLISYTLYRVMLSPLYDLRHLGGIVGAVIEVLVAVVETSQILILRILRGQERGRTRKKYEI